MATTHTFTEDSHDAAHGPLTREEVEFLRDVQAYIDWGIRNGLSFPAIMVGIGHDVLKLERYRFDLQSAYENGVCPKVGGASQWSEDQVGEVPEET